uniref:Uncharacterized protein n=1 Tax=Avena sativa TaxID=4498 RepID=A0ACD5VBH1_AVESA
MASTVAATPDEIQSGYEPSPWGDFFTGYQPQHLQERSEEWMTVRADELKEEVRKLFKTCDNTAARIFLLDTIQHLGIDHHFEQDIENALSLVLRSDFSNLSLHEVALGFLLLRQQGYWVSPDVFNKFKGEDGSFNKDITNDTKGLLSLYNGAHLLIHGEVILEEAKAFAQHHLELMKGSLSFPLAEQVKRALHVPLPRTCKRIETLHYISEYNEEEGHNTVLLELAKLDFNLLQHVHLKELKAITEWWNSFSGNVGLSFIRGRIVESYTWAYVVYHEKGFKLPRSIISKMIVIITTLDDIYDTHATIEECRKLNGAIQRWDESAVSVLPEYLKNLYMELLRTFRNIEADVPIDMNYEISYLRKSIQNHVTGYLQEAEWAHKNYTPSFKDQVDLTSLTIGAPTLSVSVMAGMADEIMKQALEWVSTVPSVVISAGKIVRFMNDIGAFKRRKCKGDAASSVECYMHEYGVSGDVAISKIDALIEDEWKTLNQARFENHALLPALQRIIGLAYTASFFYDNRNDVYTSSTLLQEIIESFFVKPV